MSTPGPRRPAGDPPGPGSPGGPGRGPGQLEPTRPGPLVLTGLATLVVGWAVRPVCEQLGVTAPIVTWGAPVALVVVVVLLAVTTWLTHRALESREHRLRPHQAVNRLLLGRACALVGAAVGGFYLGYALSWVGLDAPLAVQRATRSAVAGLAGLMIAVTGLLLERACRIRNDDEAP